MKKTSSGTEKIVSRRFTVQIRISSLDFVQILIQFLKKEKKLPSVSDPESYPDSGALWIRIRKTQNNFTFNEIMK